MAGEGNAFAKGGIGCLVIFLVLAGLSVAVGGSAHLDLVGVIMLLVIGGVIGLIINAVYQKGKKDGHDQDD